MTVSFSEMYVLAGSALTLFEGSRGLGSEEGLLARFVGWPSSSTDGGRFPDVVLSAAPGRIF